MEKLYLIDASGYLYRSYHAIQGMTNSRGESTNALFGFIRCLLKLRKDFAPQHMVAVFDGPRSLEKREAIYAEYKAHRVEMPGDLRYQIAWAQQFCELAGIPKLVVEGVEADDTLGSVAKWSEAHGAEVYLCTSDKDMAQLVTPQVKLLNTFKDNQILGPEEVQAVYGVRPDQMVDWLAITGDASDNVPGLPGFGPKTATALLQQFGTLDSLLQRAHELTGKKRETLEREGDKALLSRTLVTIDTSVAFPRDKTFFQMGSVDYAGLRDFYLDKGFHSLVRELGGDPSSSAQTIPSTFTEKYHLVDDEKSLKALIAELRQHHEICLDTETTGVRPLQASLVGVGFAVQDGEAWYVPLNGSLGWARVLAALKPLLEDAKHRFCGHNLKYDLQVLANEGIHLATVGFDTMLASYVLNSQQRRHNLDDLSLDIFGKTKIPITDLIGKGKREMSMRDVPIDKVMQYCCEDVDYTCRLKNHFSRLLQERHLEAVLQTIELPLVPVLARMERSGIYVDAEQLHAMGTDVVGQIGVIVEEVYAIAGEQFNLNSPKQLSEILFTKLGLKPPRKTATGHSTSADILESLQEEHPLAGKLLEYRTLEKLRSTYIEALPQEIDPRTGRIHPNFNQSVAATGRLACQDPNLQNIPIRTVVGRKIRAAFKPQRAGWSFLSADYSQIELRLLAHLSEDPGLLDAFRHNRDIHAQTASTVFGVPLDEVTREQRQQAKAVNFGVIYGQQAFGLGRELGIDVKAAAAFIDLYFKRYPKVRSYIEQSIARAREGGRAVTMTGRERQIPEINSKNAMLRVAAERLAVNTPLQGSAADLIKIAMIAIDQRLRTDRFRGEMILQIHDELLFEVPDDEMEALSGVVRDLMQGAMQLKVPLLVDIKVGKNWEQC